MRKQKASHQQQFCKSGALVLDLNFGNSVEHKCLIEHLCFYSPPSQSRKTSGCEKTNFSISLQLKLYLRHHLLAIGAQ